VADEIVSSADSASVAEAATAQPEQGAARPADATHGASETSEAQTDQVQDVAAEGGEDTDDEVEEDSAEGQTEEEKTKAQRRRERQRAREQQRIEEAVNARLAARDAEQARDAADAKAQADAEAASKAWQERFAGLVGTPDQHRQLHDEIAALTSEVAQMRPYADGTDLDTLEQKQAALAAKVAERDRLNANASLYRQLDAFQFEQMKGLFATRAAGMPESHRAAYASSTTIGQALERLEAGVRADEQAKAKADRDALEAEWKGKLAKEEAAHAATRTGAAVTGPSPNGANGTGVGSGLPRTLDEFRSLPASRRSEMRRTQSAYVDELYRQAG